MMPLSKKNIAVAFLVGFVNYVEWAIVMTSIYPYILLVSSHWHFYVVKIITNATGLWRINIVNEMD